MSNPTEIETIAEQYVENCRAIEDLTKQRDEIDGKLRALRMKGGELLAAMSSHEFGDLEAVHEKLMNP